MRCRQAPKEREIREEEKVRYGLKQKFCVLNSVERKRKRCSVTDGRLCVNDCCGDDVVLLLLTKYLYIYIYCSQTQNVERKEDVEEDDVDEE